MATRSGEGLSTGGAEYVTKSAELDFHQRRGQGCAPRHQEPPTKAQSACRRFEGEAGDGDAAGGFDARLEGTWETGMSRPSEGSEGLVHEVHVELEGRGQTPWR